LLASIITAISQSARRRNGHVADNLSDRTRKLAPESAHVFTRVKYSAESVGRAALRKQASIAAAAAAGRRYIHSARAEWSDKSPTDEQTGAARRPVFCRDG